MKNKMLLFLAILFFTSLIKAQSPIFSYTDFNIGGAYKTSQSNGNLFESTDEGTQTVKLTDDNIVGIRSLYFGDEEYPMITGVWGLRFLSVDPIMFGSGNVGIGFTYNPINDVDHRLTIMDGDIDINDGKLFIRDDDNSKYGIGLSAFGGNGLTLFSDYKISFTESDNSLKMIEWNMNDGIYKFNGKIFAEEIEVVVDVFADYVFEDNYELKPLHEVEKYITDNKHLPNVPSEAEVKEKGLNLGDMDVILLQKIEELTLYTIEQQKVIEELKAEINDIL
ncbi:hypothetical protein ACFLTE_07500 [Bacteroidota bacterium]